MVVKGVRKARECTIAACCGNVSFFFGLTVGRIWWEPHEQVKHCETLRLFLSVPPLVLVLHLQPHRTCYRSEMIFLLMYLLLFILALDVFPNFSLSFLYLLSETTCLPHCCRTDGQHPFYSHWRQAAKSEEFQGRNEENVDWIMEGPCRHYCLHCFQTEHLWETSTLWAVVFCKSLGINVEVCSIIWKMLEQQAVYNRLFLNLPTACSL